MWQGRFNLFFFLSPSSFSVGGTVAWESTHTSPVTNPGIIQIGRLFISCHGWQTCNYSLYLLSLSHTHPRSHRGAREGMHTNTYMHWHNIYAPMHTCTCSNTKISSLMYPLNFKEHFLTGLFLCYQTRIMKDDLCDHVWEFHFNKVCAFYIRSYHLFESVQWHGTL